MRWFKIIALSTLLRVWAGIIYLSLFIAFWNLWPGILIFGALWLVCVRFADTPPPEPKRLPPGNYRLVFEPVSHRRR